MMRDLGVDESLSKCAFSFVVGGVRVDRQLSKTGALKVGAKKRGTTYYGCLHKQIHHICLDLVDHVGEFQPDRITFESLSFGSMGDATRNLAGLFGAMRETLMVNFPDIPVYEYAPTSIKSYARDYLKDERQHEGYLATGKPKKVKMDKKMMVEAVKELYGQDYLKGYNYSTGLDDLADSTWLAHKTWSAHGQTKKT